MTSSDEGRKTNEDTCLPTDTLPTPNVTNFGVTLAPEWIKNISHFLKCMGIYRISILSAKRTFQIYF